MLTAELETKMRDVNLALEGKGYYVCVGGDFDGGNNVYTRGMQHIAAGAPIIVPVCFHNSYFREHTAGDISAVAAISSRAGADNPIIIFKADGPAEHNYRAIGKTPGEAVKLARRQNQQLDQAIGKGTSNLDVAARARVTHTKWESIAASDAWKAERAKLVALYDSCPEFKADLDALTRTVIAERHKMLNKDPEKHPRQMTAAEVTDEAVAIGVNYTFDEMAYVVSAPARMGVPAVCMTYHKDWRVFRKLIEGAYTGVAMEQFGFIGVTTVKSSYGPETRFVRTIGQIETIAEKGFKAAGTGTTAETSDASPASRSQATRPVASLVHDQEAASRVVGRHERKVRLADRITTAYRGLRSLRAAAI